MNRFKISVIIPAYNEERRITYTLREICNYFENHDFDYEIIVIDDGSNDKTAEKVKAFKNKNIILLRNEVNCGKGYAVRRGVLNACGDIIIFVDADNSTPIEELDKFLPHIKNNLILIGSRYLKDSSIEVKQPPHRILISRLGNILVRFLLRLEIQDSQCGFKVFYNSNAKEIFSRQRINRYAFDMEILAIGKSLGYKIKEVPIKWRNSQESKVKPIKDSLVTFFDLLRIKINLERHNYN